MLRKLFRNLIFTLLLITVLLFLINNYIRFKNYNNTDEPEHANDNILRAKEIKKIKNIAVKPKNQAYKKYVIYECVDRRCGGWADRLKGILNAYAWSLITKREFLINITQPCNIYNLLDSNKIKWNQNLDDLIETGHLKKNYSKYILSKIDDSKYRSDLRFVDVINFEKDADIISIRTNLEWFGPLARNKYVHDRLIELGFVPNKFDMNLVFKSWFNKLFKLSKKLDLTYRKFLKNVKNNETNLICAQVRIGGKRPNVRYDKVFTKLENSKYYWDYINETFIQKLNKNDDNYKIFVTTDTESVEKESVKIFGKDKVVSIKGIFTHIDREYDNGDDCSRYEKIMLDFFILGECDMVSNVIFTYLFQSDIY